MVAAQELLLESNDDVFASGVFFYKTAFILAYEQETKTAYSGMDVSFYDSPSGMTVLPEISVDSGTGPNIFTPSLASQTREIAFWEYLVLAALIGPLRILRFPMWLVEGGRIMTGLLPHSPQSLPQ